MRRTRRHANTQWQALQVTARSPRDGPGRVTQSRTLAGTHLGLAGLTSHDHGTGYQLSTNALTGKLLQGPGNTREQRGMHGSISSFGDDSAHKKRAQRAQQHTHPSARASHLPSPTPPPCSTTVALRQLGAYTCLQHASAFERRSTRPTHRLPHSPHTRERRRPHAHDARHASALRASHSFGRPATRAVSLTSPLSTRQKPLEGQLSREISRQ